MDLKALFSLSYGLYVVTSVYEDKINGQIANSAFQITAEPARIAVSLNKQNLTHDYVENSGLFAVSVLEKDVPMKFIGNFGFKSGRDINKFENVEYKILDGGVPAVLDHSLSYIAAKVVNKTDVGTHTIFVGEIFDAYVIKKGEPMTYAYYHEVKMGKSPKTAPTYSKE